MNSRRVLLLLALFWLIQLRCVAAAEFLFKPDDKLAAYCEELLHSQDVAAFAKKVCPSIEDYEAEARRFGRNLTADEHTALERSVQNDIRNLARSGEQFVKVGKRFGFFSPGTQWQFKGAKADEVMMTSHSVHHGEETMPHLHAIRLMFRREESTENASSLKGDYSIDLIFALQFPAGWRISNGMRWSGFPKSAVPDGLRDDMQLAASFPGLSATLSQNDDRALRLTAESLKDLLAAQDTADRTLPLGAGAREVPCRGV